MSRDDPEMTSPMAVERLICDVTQSWSEVGGGVGTYLRHKRNHILGRTPHRHLLIVPGAEDNVTVEGRAITATVRSPRVPGSPNYRLMLRNGAVRRIMEQFRPDLIECQDSYNLPWAAIAHRRKFPDTALVGGYFTDFPTVYAERPFSKVIGSTLAGVAGRICYRYCGQLYRRFDAVFALSENGGAAKLRSYGVDDIGIVPLGVELGDFGPALREERRRQLVGAEDGKPLLIYVGRLDLEKKPQIVVEAFRKLPESLGARLVLLGEGPLRDEIAALGDPRIHAPGFVRDRRELALWLASADIYVSGMADETFGVSIVEAQASGLPVVGVAAGAMVDRVNDAIGRLGPVDDSDAMAANILAVWQSDRRRMSEIAQVEAHQYSWDRSMETLFGPIYRKAFAARTRRVVEAAPMAAPLAVPAE
ncbi:glycosyltransferase family 1 protein [Sphingomonas daechungensis]|uniref:Glycosyltransferase n=1 Tax=Sphingomonas daechungensis TaxID=1176646 RepID=A0ABX6SZP6_9SPHN|nr:glycosyltransferase [Sphingomonas daechungensis]QNP43031.1 glycosyltransferase [Sphingomonas daechungensis]